MLGAIIGDIVGSIYEFDNHRSKQSVFFGDPADFTEDTVCNDRGGGRADARQTPCQGAPVFRARAEGRAPLDGQSPAPPLALRLL